MTTPAPTDGSYQTDVEVLAILERRLASSDVRRTAYESLSTADRQVCCRQATDDLDAQLWIGRSSDDAMHEGRQWPRVNDSRTRYIGRDVSPMASGVSAWSYGDGLMPREIRVAHAVQAAARASRSLALTDQTESRDLAQAGIAAASTSQGGSVSRTVDLHAAADPWSVIDVEAADVARRWRRSGGHAV